MSFSIYSEYKDSGTQWLGRVPAHWQEKWLDILSMNTASAFVDGPFGSDLKSSDYQDDGIPLIQLNNIRDGRHILRNMKFISEDKRDELSRHTTVPGDVAIAKMADPVARACVVSDAFPEYVIVADCVKMTPNLTLVNLSYLIWAMNSDCVRISAELMSSGVTRIRINLGQIKKLKVPYPPLSEQETIAKFLDHETAKIDALIAEQQRLIELLKEKRQAVISHAVTKGLDSNAPMKDSGVEWLGEVPAHWRCMSYRYATRIIRGKFGHRPRNDPALYDGDFPFIQTGDVARASKYITEYKQTLNDRGASVSAEFPAGTLVMAIAANIGDTAILQFDAYAPDSVVGFKPSFGIDLEYLRYSLDSSIQALEQTSTQSTQANLNIDRVGGVKAAFPPQREQIEIVKYLDNICDQFSSLMNDMESSIGIMMERRSALISAAVTGKIDVRSWQADTAFSTAIPMAAEDAARYG